MRNIYCLVIAFALVACNFTTVFSTPYPPTDTAMPPTESYVEEVQCAWVWASKRSPDLSSQLQERLTSVGLTHVSGDVAIFGEDCIDPQENKAVRFAAMQTEFYLEVEGDQPDGEEGMGDLLIPIIALLRDVAANGTPGPQPDRVRLEWIEGEAVFFAYLESGGGHQF